MNRNEKCFLVTPEHKGTKMKLKKIKPLGIKFILYNSDLMMKDPLITNISETL